ncbi:MAG TPA: hypothetical protein VMV75_09810 [Sulfuricella sp.]|nr:hypothetical protein [Sulfuricella sp.]
MNEKIRRLSDQITALENELRTELRERENHLLYQIKGKRIEFECSIREAHLQLKQGIFRWFLTVRPQNFLTAPIIYGIVIPLALFDLCVMIYQFTCFPIYGIPRVRRSDHIAIDHQHLAYLNFIEKGHCIYCSYASGIISYAREVVARTEQYFCPIKHAHKMLGTHERYARFLDYGEGDNFHARLEEFRKNLAGKKTNEDR